MEMGWLRTELGLGRDCLTEFFIGVVIRGPLKLRRDANPLFEVLQSWRPVSFFLTPLGLFLPTSLLFSLSLSLSVSISLFSFSLTFAFSGPSGNWLGAVRVSFYHPVCLSPGRADSLTLSLHRPPPPPPPPQSTRPPIHPRTHPPSNHPPT